MKKINETIDECLSIDEQCNKKTEYKYVDGNLIVGLRKRTGERWVDLDGQTIYYFKNGKIQHMYYSPGLWIQKIKNFIDVKKEDNRIGS